MPTIIGTPGPDGLVGTAGDDYIDGQGSADSMQGLEGNDTYVVDNAGDVIIEADGEGSDRLYALASYVLAGGVSIEEMFIGGNDDLAPIDLTGNELGNNLYGNSGTNHLNGGGGDDFLFGNAGADFLDGGIGTDKLFGGTGDDILTGGAGNDYLQGNAGNDILDGSQGADLMMGLADDDIYIVDDPLDDVRESAGEGEDRVYALISWALAAGSAVEILAAGGSVPTAAINLVGNELDNNIWGNAGSNSLQGLGGHDALFGFGGNDYLDGGSGADLLAGGTGDDVYVIDDSGDVVAESAGEGTDTIYALASYALAAGVQVEQLFAGGPDPTKPIDLIGNDLANVIRGNDGVNVLQGAGGVDTMLGFGGDDILSGGSGGDELRGGDGNDILYGESAGVFNNDTLGDRLYGGAGNDILDGSGGASPNSGIGYGDLRRDVLSGGPGDDIYIVRNGNTGIEELVGEGYDEVWLYASYGLSGTQYNPDPQVETIRIVGTGNINAGGNGFNNYIDGNSSANVINGGGGDDVINGLGGADMLNGGDGADRFIFSTDLFDVFDNNPDPYASIRDFQPGIDKIVLENSLFTALSPGPLPASAFGIGTVATTPEQRILFDPVGGLLFYDANGSEPGGYYLFGHIYGFQPSAGDFIVT